VRGNVIPSEARATLNIRLLPGDTIDVLLAELTKLVNDPQIRFEVQPDAGLAAPPSSLESEFYASITKAASQEFPGVPVLPFMSAGATDSAQLRLHNVQAYGVSPFPMTDEDSRRMHADDERIPLASFEKGVDFLARIISEFAASR
jgi:acetylornithine deacetylase/succinyl-diaminopimelate desuccinylase-like protein